MAERGEIDMIAFVLISIAAVVAAVLITIMIYEKIREYDRIEHEIEDSYKESYWKWQRDDLLDTQAAMAASLVQCVKWIKIHDFKKEADWNKLGITPDYRIVVPRKYR